MSDQDVVLPIPNLELPQQLFLLSNPALKRLHDEARIKLLDGIKADNMAPYYRKLTGAPSGSVTSPMSPTSSSSVVQFDSGLLDSMEASNKAELEKLDEQLEQAEKTEGESEIADALRARANFFTRIADKEKALPALQLALEKTAGVGSRIDLTLTLVRVGLFFGDNDLIIENLAKADKLIAEGGDWDRLNRLKAYRALHHLALRNFASAFPLFCDALATFTATELCTYEAFVAYATLVGVVQGGRNGLKKKIIDSPEVNAVLPELPVHADLIKSLYDCKYDKFFVALAKLEHDHLLTSRLFSPHARFYIRECRILAYSQHLESYRSLTLESLAAAFGVSEKFIDEELSRFIANGRLHCTIDKVNGVVSTVRPGNSELAFSAKYVQYETVVKKGDALLGKVQRLSKVLY